MWAALGSPKPQIEFKVSDFWYIIEISILMLVRLNLP